MHQAAIRLLARREHGAHELADKLVRRGHAPAAAAAEVERLAAAGLQSDARFVEAFVEQRVGHGDGPLKIRAALVQRRIAAERIEAALAPFEEEWPQRATAALHKRFGEAPAGTWQERARRARFLQQRGFPAEIVRRTTEFDAPDD